MVFCILLLFFHSTEAVCHDRGTGLSVTPDALIYLNKADLSKGGYFGNYAIIVEKSTQQLILFVYDGVWREVDRFFCSTGKISGDKLLSGDKKTPEGVYFFINKFRERHLSKRYGSLAFPVDYPNQLDRLEKKTGHSIWLHGTNKPLKDRDSNGCIVLANKDIKYLAEKIQLYQTPIIITKCLTFVSTDQIIQKKNKLFGFLKHWNYVLGHAGLEKFKPLYEDNGLPGAALWLTWFEQRRELKPAELNMELDIDISSIFYYQAVYRVILNQKIRFSGSTTQVGRLSLFLKEENQKLTIIAENFKPFSAGVLISNDQPSLPAVWQKIINNLPQKFPMAGLINQNKSSENRDCYHFPENEKIGKKVVSYNKIKF